MKLENQLLCNLFLNRGRSPIAIKKSFEDFEVVTAMALAHVDHSDMIRKILISLTAQIQSISLIFDLSVSKICDEIDYLYYYWYLEFLLGLGQYEEQQLSNKQRKLIKSVSQSLKKDQNPAHCGLDFLVSNHSISSSDIQLLNFIKLGCSATFRQLVLAKSLELLSIKNDWTSDEIRFNLRFELFDAPYFLFNPLTFENFEKSTDARSIGIISLVNWVLEGYLAWNEFSKSVSLSFVSDLQKTIVSNIFVCERNFKKLQMKDIADLTVEEYRDSFHSGSCSIKFDWKHDLFPVIKLML
ncbi:hypothetical protein P9112_011610 [Eukaryota sp. TZLM1-RC]